MAPTALRLGSSNVAECATSHRASTGNREIMRYLRHRPRRRAVPRYRVAQAEIHGRSHYFIEAPCPGPITPRHTSLLHLRMAATLTAKEPQHCSYSCPVLIKQIEAIISAIIWRIIQYRPVYLPCHPKSRPRHRGIAEAAAAFLYASRSGNIRNFRAALA